MELDFGELFENPEKLKELGELQEPESFSQVTELLKDLPGIKINPMEELKIEFKE